MKKSFTLLELLIVIIIIGILAYSLSFKFNNSLQIAADQVIKDIRYTQSLALKDDKYQPFPEEDNVTEQNRSKYWFKQWWQIRFFTNNNGNFFYEIFSDSPGKNHNFNRLGDPVSEFAKNPLTGKYMTGNYDANTTSEDLNLSKTGVKKLRYNIGSEFKNITTNKSLRFVFDNLGNVFLDEGDAGDRGDINPLDEKNRTILTTTAKIQLCLDNNCNKNKDRCVQINITPTGEVYKSLCN